MESSQQIASDVKETTNVESEQPRGTSTDGDNIQTEAVAVDDIQTTPAPKESLASAGKVGVKRRADYDRDNEIKKLKELQQVCL